VKVPPDREVDADLLIFLGEPDHGGDASAAVATFWKYSL
jgi:hypothetical protein